MMGCRCTGGSTGTPTSGLPCGTESDPRPSVVRRWRNGIAVSKSHQILSANPLIIDAEESTPRPGTRFRSRTAGSARPCRSQSPGWCPLAAHNSGSDQTRRTQSNVGVIGVRTSTVRTRYALLLACARVARYVQPLLPVCASTAVEGSVAAYLARSTRGVAQYQSRHKGDRMSLGRNPRRGENPIDVFVKAKVRLRRAS